MLAIGLKSVVVRGLDVFGNMLNKALRLAVAPHLRTHVVEHV